MLGQETAACFKCRTPLSAADFDSGRAYRFGEKTVCAACSAMQRTTADIPIVDRAQPVFLFVWIGAAVLVAAIAVAILGRAPVEPPKPPVVPPAAATSREERAKEALDKARIVQRLNPEEPARALRAYRELVQNPDFQGTPAADAGRQELDALEKKLDRK